MIYRKATKEDIEVLAELRKRQLIDEGLSPEPNMDKELITYFNEQMSTQKLVEWVLEDQGIIVATGAIQFLDMPPCFTNKTGVRGYITNMYTAPEYRGRGIASKMLELLKQEAQNRGVKKMFLGASVLGKPVYKKFGFKDSETLMDMEI